MRYALHDLNPTSFEELVVELCTELLGLGVQAFGPGPDGGRDGQFTGTADAYPSRSAPLSGKMIIQAKHTIDAIGKFSDVEFSGASPKSTLSEELPRIKALYEAGRLDHYFLFSNRRLGGIANQSIQDRIADQTGVTSVHLFGVEQMERLIKRSPFAATKLQDFEYALPLRASPDELAEVITAIASVQIDCPGTSVTPLQRTAFKKKNELNGLSDEYAMLITRNYLKHFSTVESFLNDPVNQEVLSSYNDAVDEFSAKLVAHRGDFESYDKLLNYLESQLIKRDGDLKANKKLTRTVFYFMYWSCDIGTTGGEHDATAT